MMALTGAFRAQLNSVMEHNQDSGALTDADFRGCRWIEGDPRPLRQGMFCGLPVAPGESWCTRHRHLVFGQELPLAG
jgi:hypothetical protein